MRKFVLAIGSLIVHKLRRREGHAPATSGPLRVLPVCVRVTRRCVTGGTHVYARTSVTVATLATSSHVSLRSQP